jgi:hypothetical protein
MIKSWVWLRSIFGFGGKREQISRGSELGPGTAHNDVNPGRIATFKGWRYQLLPNNIHMNYCEEQACDRSSRVSYQIVDGAYTLERFKLEEQRTADIIRAGGGTIVNIEQPVEERDGKFHFIKGRRTETTPDGMTSVTVSWIISSEKMAMRVTSSSNDPNAAERNFALFAVPVMMFTLQPGLRFRTKGHPQDAP